MQQRGNRDNGCDSGGVRGVRGGEGGRAERGMEVEGVRGWRCVLPTPYISAIISPLH